MRALFRARLRLIVGGVLMLALLVVLRLYFVEVVHGKEYALKADRQYQAAGGTLFDHGSIYFARKDGTLISAATLATGFVVAVNPNALVNPEAVYEAIAALAPRSIDRDAFFKAVGNTDALYVEVAHHLDDAAGKALVAQRLPGVTVLRERWVVYPGKDLAAQTIGIVGYGGGDTLTGQTGLESAYDATLARTGSLYTNFFAELFSNLGNFVVDARAASEGNLVTTIEPAVETRLMDDLKAVALRYWSRETGGIIMDPLTGALYALGSVPTYDANDLSTITPALLANPLVEHVYEFGSILKPLTIAAGLDAGAITPTSSYNDTGCLVVDTATICNYDRKARGVTPVQQILSQSLNLGAAWVATRLGPPRFRTYFTALFGEKSGVDLPSESDALTKNLSSPRQLEYDNMAFGQGIAVTPMQMIRALGALANGGAMVSPHIVSAVALDSGVTRTLDWSARTPVFGSAAARDVSTMLTQVVDTKLGNGAAKIPSMSVAAKTGTAQLTNGKGGYYQDRYVHSFFGYFPSYAPRFILLLYTVDPQGVQYASETLTPTFEDLVHFLIGYYAVPPDRAP